MDALSNPGRSIGKELFGREERTERMSNLRRTISRRLVEAKNSTAMLTTFNEVDMSPVMDLRTKYKEVFKKHHEVNLGFMSFFTKACCFALQEWPAVNAGIDGDNIIYHDYCDISIAVGARWCYFLYINFFISQYCGSYRGGFHSGAGTLRLFLRLGKVLMK